MVEAIVELAMAKNKNSPANIDCPVRAAIAVKDGKETCWVDPLMVAELSLE